MREVSDYIHLNPARARLLSPEAPDLRAFGGSSFPVYAGRAKGPRWLQTARVLGSHGLGEDARGRRDYAAYMGGRMAEVWTQDPHLQAREWREIRRGWYWGDEGFKERLLEQLARVVSGRKRESYTGAAAQAHDERMAAQWLQRGLAALARLSGFNPLVQLFSLRKRLICRRAVCRKCAKVAVVKTYSIPKAKEVCIIGSRYVFALHDAKEERQGASLLQLGGKPAGGQRPGDPTPRSLPGRDQRQMWRFTFVV